ncbi:MAG: hypothetical protein ACRDMY_13610 [Gaiellaceae bacterium]
MFGKNRLVVTTLCLAALAGPPVLYAHFQSGHYSHKKSDCASRTDPITIVFYGFATADRVNNHVRHHTGWGGGTGGGQHFASHGVCGGGTRHAESGTFTRYHIRLRKTYHDDATWWTTTTGTPHHEDWSTEWGCNYGFGGHAVDKGGVSQEGSNWSGFDMGRKHIFNALYQKSGHGFAGSVNWGNTREFKQCDGDKAGSNGTVFWFHVPNSYH